MTPEERSLITQFLGDLARLQAGPKDPEADALIRQAFAAQPDAAYLLVQHSLLADQALHASQDRIQQLETQLRAPATQPQASSFLSGGPAPNVGYSQAQAGYGQAQPGYGQPQPGYGTAVPPSPAPGFFGGGAPAQSGGLGSFLRGAGTTAAGVAGGAFLFEGLSNLFGGGRGGGGGFFGGGYPQEVENVTVNNYDDGGGFGGGDDFGGGGDWSDNSGGDF